MKNNLKKIAVALLGILIAFSPIIISYIIHLTT